MDYRVKITIRNNRLLKAIEDKGYRSVSDFCRKTNLQEGLVNLIVRGATKPLRKDGSLNPTVLNLLEYLDLSVEDAFTERQLQGFNKNSFQVEMNENQLSSLTSPQQNTEVIAMEKDLTKTLDSLMLALLTPREEQCVRSYYYQNKTLSIIAKEHGVTMERARQIISKGLNCLSSHYKKFEGSGIKEVFPGVGSTCPLVRRNSRSFVKKKCDNLTPINS